MGGVVWSQALPVKLLVDFVCTVLKIQVDDKYSDIADDADHHDHDSDGVADDGTIIIGRLRKHRPEN